jgi:glutathione synthetase
VHTDGGYTQNLSLGLFRSDYMIHQNREQPGLEIKQVEFNTIAASFAGLATQAQLVHARLADERLYPSPPGGPTISSANIPANDALKTLSAGLEAAHRAYLSQPERKAGGEACVAFVVQDGERNVFDQAHLRAALEARGVRAVTVVWDRILDELALGPGAELIYTPPDDPQVRVDVSVVYLRAGYAPTEYRSPGDWAARAMVERSRAIKCPTVLTQLAGTKKVQQVLATPAPAPDLLGRLLAGAGARDAAAGAAALRRTFAPMHPMDAATAAGREGRRLATDEREARRFVLKPQREGGGNNVYRAGIPRFLAAVDPAGWEAWVLMEMIEPPAQENAIVRAGEARGGGVVCELGVFGACLWEGGAGGVRVLENVGGGYLLRTKGSGSHEGGVAAGFGALDTPYLVPDGDLL